ncbi:MAG: hypothetical protein ACHQWU_03675 [Gemmatimonadales bacterium]
MAVLPWAAAFPRTSLAQSRPAGSMAGMDHMDDGMDGSMDANMMKHMTLTPQRPATHADSVRALTVASELKRAIAKYQDTAAAVADGYRMFLPGVKAQRVFHFTNNGHALRAAFSFDPAKPTSILYKRESDGRLHLVGAMYTAPNTASLDRLNSRVPLSIAHWHEHVNWCLPKRDQAARYSERKEGHPVFGPESPIDTKAACDAVNGQFYPRLFGWMVHVNVFEASDLGSIFGDHGAG